MLLGSPLALELAQSSEARSAQRPGQDLELGLALAWGQGRSTPKNLRRLQEAFR